MPSSETFVCEIPLDQIEPSPLNPRREFDQERLAELAASLMASGLLQPVVVRADGARFVLIAGERRWRAAQLAGWERIAARVLEVADDREALALAIAENLQREELSAIEEAQAYRRLAELGYSQAQMAAAVGKSQPAVANTMRLLDLPEAVQQRIQAGALAPAAGRALLALKEFPSVCDAMAERVIAHQIPVRILERAPLAAREWELAQAGLVRPVDDRTPWAWQTVCREGCPFGAYRDAHGTVGGVCLRPEHYDELAAAARQEAPLGELIQLPRADRAEEEAQRAALWQQTRLLLDGGKLLADRRMVAALCVDRIAETKHETLKAFAEEGELPAPLLAELLRADVTRLGVAQQLAEYAPQFVARLALLCLLRTEAEESSHRRHPPRLAQWLTGRELAEEPESGPGAGLRQLIEPDEAPAERAGLR